MRLRTRLRNAIRAFRGEEVLTDLGLQRIGTDGEILTLAKTAFAIWVVTEDPAEAQRTLADRLENQFGEVEWVR